MRTGRSPFWVAATLLNSACGVDCTLRPCPGLAVQLEGAVPSEYSVTLSSPSEPSVTRTCNATSACLGNLVQFVGYSPDIVTVSVLAAGSTVAVTVEPNYGTVYPNGEDCGECRTATITLAVP
jgi:hypothetical protein